MTSMEPQNVPSSAKAATAAGTCADGHSQQVATPSPAAGGQKRSQQVSIIATVLNELETIDALLDSLAQQTRRPDEIVVVDGGSTDGTVQRLAQHAASSEIPIRVLSLPGCNISAGRNAAIRAANSDIIVSTDAGVRLELDWLEQLIAPLCAEPETDVVSGFFVPDPQSTFEIALGRITLPRLEEIDPAKFHPSSRSVAYRRSACEAVGGYPEWLDYCEDLLFDFALRDAGYRFAFAPRAIVHFRPRSNLRAFIRQYYRYARGDGKADFWRYRHAIRYGTYGVALAAAILALVYRPAFWLLVVCILLATLRGPLRRLAPALPSLAWRQRLAVLAWAPIIRWSGDIAKMCGYPVGVCWRWHHAPMEPWPKRQL